MGIVAIECPRCSSTSDAPAGVLVLEGSGPDLGLPDGGTVTWICPSCSMLVHRPIGWHDLLVLLSAGAALIDEEDVDDRPRPPGSMAGGVAWTHDDLLDLHLLLSGTGWFAELEALLRNDR